MFCSIPFRSGFSCSRPFYSGSSRSNLLYGFYSLSLSLSPPSLSLSLYVSFSPPLSWCLSLLRLGSVFSRPGVMSVGLQTLLPPFLPPFLQSSLPFPGRPSFLPSFLIFLPLVSFMSSQVGERGERTHRRTGEHAEKGERKHARENIGQ